MEDRKAGYQNNPDVEIRSAASFNHLHVKKSGKVKIKFYSNHTEHKLHESYRKNIPEELQDGGTYTDGEIRMRIESSIREDSDEFDIT